MKLNIALIGGYGFWSEKQHIRSIKKYSNEAKLAAIVELQDQKPSQKVREVMQKHKTVTLVTSDFKNEQEILATLAKKQGIDLVIIASNPVTHFKYARAALRNGISVLIDKPIIVHRNSASSTQSAEKILREYEQLMIEYERAKKRNNSILCSVILRRRGVDAFYSVAKQLNGNYLQSRVPVDRMRFDLDSGLPKLIRDYKTEGAHGFQDGIGALAHSAYHYLDLLLWYFEMASGEAKKLEIRLEHLERVRDYLNSSTYESLKKTLGYDEKKEDISSLPDKILNSEVNFSFRIDSFTETSEKIGSYSFRNLHTSFSPRTIVAADGPHPDIANNVGGGRMSQLHFYIQQGMLQTWFIDKRDIVFSGNKIRIETITHPNSAARSEIKEYTNAYSDASISQDTMFKQLIDAVSRIDDHSPDTAFFKDLSDERLNLTIYSKMYEMISEYDAASSHIPVRVVKL